MKSRIAIAVSALVALLCAGGALRAQDAQPSTPPSIEAPPGTKPSTPTRVRVGGNVQAAKMIHQVQPVYPQIAKTAHVQGTVILHTIVAMDGTIRELQYVSGPALLMRSAMDAVRQWRYAPTLLSGEPVEVDTVISVVYTLDEGGGAGNQDQTASEIDPQLKADVLRLMEVMHIRDQMKTLLQGVFELMRPQLLAEFAKQPDREKIINSINDKLTAIMQSDELVDGFVAIYARHLSEDDVKAAIDFYMSAPGQHLLANVPQVMAEARQLGQDLVRRHLVEIMNQICREYPDLKNSPGNCAASDTDKKSQLQRWPATEFPLADAGARGLR